VIIYLDDSALTLEESNGYFVFSLAGSYEITYYAEDSSGNYSIETISITVHEYIPPTDLENIDYSGFNNYYISLNDSYDVITDLAWLLRDTIYYKSYDDARYVYVSYDEDYQVVLYDYSGSTTYGLVPKEWGDGGKIYVDDVLFITVEREHVWACNDMRIKPTTGQQTITEYVDYVLNEDNTFNYRPSGHNKGHYSDLHNIWISLGSANGSHSDHFYGEEDGPSEIYYLMNSIFYPGDEYIGDIARILFYMTLMYPCLTLVNQEDENAVKGSVYYGFLDVLLQWNLEDPVSDYEIARNETIFAAQGNRNPFIDFYTEGFAELLFTFGDPNVIN